MQSQDGKESTDQVARQRAVMFETVAAYEAEQKRLADEIIRRRIESDEARAESAIRVAALEATIEAHSRSISALRAQVEDITASKSWRLTRPMRRLAQSVRRRRK